MPESDAVGKITAAEAGVIGTILMAIGAGLTKAVSAISDRFKNRDDQIASIERERFQIVMDEWKNDRVNSAAAIKENSLATKELSAAVKDLTAKLEPIPTLTLEVHELKGAIAQLVHQQ